jgi:hypothetical protein
MLNNLTINQNKFVSRDLNSYSKVLSSNVNKFCLQYNQKEENPFRLKGISESNSKLPSTVSLKDYTYKISGIQFSDINDIIFNWNENDFIYINEKFLTFSYNVESKKLEFRYDLNGFDLTTNNLSNYISMCTMIKSINELKLIFDSFIDAIGLSDIISFDKDDNNNYFLSSTEDIVFYLTRGLQALFFGSTLEFDGNPISPVTIKPYCMLKINLYRNFILKIDENNFIHINPQLVNNNYLELNQILNGHNIINNLINNDSFLRFFWMINNNPQYEEYNNGNLKIFNPLTDNDNGVYGQLRDFIYYDFNQVYPNNKTTCKSVKIFIEQLLNVYI